MDENTVFKDPALNFTPGLTTPPGLSSPPQPPPPPSQKRLPFSRSAIFKGMIGIVVFLGFIFFITSLVIPYFRGQNKGKAIITYWGLWEDPRVMEMVLADFERENPKIKVSYIKQDVKQYRNRLETRIENGTGPDVFRFHNTWVNQLSNILLPLPQDVITPEDFKQKFYEVAQKDMIKNGAIYGIPLGIDTLSLFVNTQLFETAGVEIPTTWEDFIRAARIMTVKDETGKIKTAGAAMGTFDNINHAPDIISLLFVQNGADLVDLSTAQQASSDALSFYTSFATGEGNVWDNSLDPSILAFSGGNLGMYFGYSWDIFTIKALSPNLPFKVVSVPHLPGRNMTIASYWAEGVSVKSKQQKEALLLLKFLARKEVVQKLYSEASKTRMFGQPYAQKELAQTLKDNPLVYPFIEQAETAVSSFFVSDTHDEGLNSRMNAYLGNAVHSILNGTSAQSAVETLASGVAQVLSQYGQ